MPQMKANRCLREFPGLLHSSGIAAKNLLLPQVRDVGGDARSGNLMKILRSYRFLELVEDNSVTLSCRITLRKEMFILESTSCGVPSMSPVHSGPFFTKHAPYFPELLACLFFLSGFGRDLSPATGCRVQVADSEDAVRLSNKMGPVDSITHEMAP